jgi:hypothetical protein
VFFEKIIGFAKIDEIHNVLHWLQCFNQNASVLEQHFIVGLLFIFPV